MENADNIVSTIINKENLENQLLASTISIEDTVYTCTMKAISSCGITIWLPEDFTEMDAEQAKKKYISEYRPNYILTDTTTTINFTFMPTDISLKPEEINQYLNDYKSAIKQLQPADLFYTKNIIHNNDTSIGYLDYVAYAIDGKAYTFIFILPIEESMLFCTFSCPEKQKDQWKPYLIEMLKSIEIISKEGESIG